MKAQINENISKSRQWLTFTISQLGKILHYIKFEGQDCLKEFENHLQTKNLDLGSIKHVSCYINSAGIDYLKLFEKVEILDLRGGKNELKFPNLNKLKFLQSIFINDQKIPTQLMNISTATEVKDIFIGNFTFNKPVEITSFDEFLRFKKLENLLLSNTKFTIDELKKLSHSKSLKSLTLNQNFEFEELAELSTILTSVECKELRAWQKAESKIGDVKINGKRKPYLNSKTDQEKIKKYEKEFNKLREITLSNRVE